jgi:branched-chain amino acid transport system permease protein
MSVDLRGVMDTSYFFELSINGALAGLLYSLVAIGIVLIYKSSSVPNLAQGALTMAGAYLVLAFSEAAGLPMWLAIPLAMVTMCGLGIGIERVALRRLAGRPIVMSLMMTLGIDIFLRATTLGIGGATTRSLSLGISDDPLFVGSVLVNRSYLVGAGVTVVLFICFALFFRTRRGIALQAIADDYLASWSVGISVERGIALSWALACVAATAAGTLWGSIQGVDQSLSLLLLKGITVAVLGGMDSLHGSLLAGIGLGAFESVAAGVLDPQLGGGSRDLVVALALIVTIMMRPHGLFGRPHIERL